MAGPRRAQYVSIPLGPGVLTNTTGRGARTRQNYMNWDRWKDATWVRWHKLLPEKQGGWQYQALVQAGINPPVLPGAPALLLHLNTDSTEVDAALLLHMDGTNGAISFPDSSVNNITMSVAGSATVTTTDPKFGTGSLRQPDTTTAGHSSVYAPITPGGPLDILSDAGGDFTIECFFLLSATNTANLIICDYGGDRATFANPSAVIIAANCVSPGVGSLTANPTIPGWSVVGTGSPALFTDTWYHVAVVRHGATTTLYLDGQPRGTAADWHGYSFPATSFVSLGWSAVQIGGLDPGQIDDFRVTPYAVYTAAFTPPAAPLTPTITVPNQPDFSDASLYHWPMTAHGAATIETGNPKFGTGALQLDGATAYLSTPVTSGGPLDLSQGDFTLEFWLYSSNENSNWIVDASNGDTAGFFVEQLTSANIQANIWNGSAYVTITAPVAQNTWTAVALVRHGGVFTLYTGGVAAGTQAIAGSIGPMGGLLGIGGGFSTSVLGDIDEVRLTLTAVYTTTYTPATAENTLGLPNSLGTATPPNAFAPATYLGVARDLHDWSSIDGQYWIAAGTHVKLYVVNQSTLYDVTPQRKTSNVVDALTTALGSPVVTVADAGHQAATGDYVTVTGAAVVGGIQIAGNYQVTVVDPDTYTVVAAQTATAAAAGGGHFSIAYDLGTGLPSNGELLGYGTGVYGALTYGTPRLPGQGVFARMRTWSLDNYGQDLVASQSDGEIYIWQRNSGPNSRAMIVPNAPQGVQRVIVDAQQRVIIALGCTDVTSAFDAMLVRWCSFDDITDWMPTDVNTAGDDILVAGSRIITGLKTKGQNLIFTDTTVYRMVFVGSPDIYDFIPAGAVTIVGPNACVDVDGVAYLMGFDNFYNYSGTLNLQACDVWETVFDPTVPTSLNRTQAEGVVCYTYEPKTEVTWLYPSIGGAPVVRFTASLSQGATTATLAAPWAQPTGLYTVQFDDQEAQPVHLTAGGTAATWNLPLLGSVGAAATLIGNDRYVTFNWEDGTWYCGAWYRTCAQGRAPAMQGFPYGVNAGYLYRHEVGTDAVEAAGTVALGFFMQSLDITTGGAKSEYTMGGSDARFAIGGSDSHLLLRSVLPDWKYFTGAMNLTVSTKDRPQDAAYVQSGPVAFDDATTQIDIDANGSQLVIQLDNFTAGGGAPSLGCSFRMGILQGLAVPYVKR